MADRRMILGTIINSVGLHLAAWLYPSVDPTRRDIKQYAEMAATAERGKLDFLFMADSLAMMYSNMPEVLKRIAPLNDYDPVSLLSALSVTTSDIALIASATTTYFEPFDIARRFASLDELSGGRAGWNVITSVNPAEDGNFAHIRKSKIDERYRRAVEMVKVTRALWDSWQPGAVIGNRNEALFYDQSKVGPIDHEGEFFKVKGPLTVQRPPQGHPIIVQSGSSDIGRDVGTSIADLIFTAQQTLGEAQEFYRDVKRRAAEKGRNPDHIKIILGVVPILGLTDEEAEAKFDKVQSLIHPDVGLSLLGHLLGEIDLKQYPVDGPLPEFTLDTTKHGRLEMLVDLAKRENLTIRQLYMKVAAGARGHWTVHGSAKRVADIMEEWFKNEAADGFTIIPPFLPEGLDDAVNLLIPELQSRGLFQSEYASGTAREKLGLPLLSADVPAPASLSIERA